MGFSNINIISSGKQRGFSKAATTGSKTPTETLLYFVDAGRTLGGMLNGTDEDTLYASGGEVEDGLGLTVSDAMLQNPVPQSLWNTKRLGNHSYFFSGLVANTPHRVEVITTEDVFTQSGQRIMNVTINNIEIQSNFDVWAESGGAKFVAVDVLKNVGTITASSAGQIIIFIFGADGSENGQVFGIRIYKL